MKFIKLKHRVQFNKKTKFPIEKGDLYLNSIVQLYKILLKIRANSFNTGIASEYLILSKLYRPDLEAYISQGNKKSIDIRVINKYGETLTIDVKSVRGYSSLVVNNVQPKNNHFLVFVIYNNKFEDLNEHPDIFIVPSQKICEPLVSTFKKEKRIMKGKLLNYKDKWNLLFEQESKFEFNEIT